MTNAIRMPLRILWATQIRQRVFGIASGYEDLNAPESAPRLPHRFSRPRITLIQNQRVPVCTVGTGGTTNDGTVSSAPPRFSEHGTSGTTEWRTAAFVPGVPRRVVVCTLKSLSVKDFKPDGSQCPLVQFRLIQTQRSSVQLRYTN
jgi:hypothetical protein